MILIDRKLATVVMRLTFNANVVITRAGWVCAQACISHYNLSPTHRGANSAKTLNKIRAW